MTESEAPRYRSDIDGLRALSVVLVVLFHAGLGVPGGYIGVDVFFVISGFLITGIIIRGLQQGSFSLFDFYCRRVRRIFPALAVVLLVTLLVAYRSFLPTDFQQVGKASIYQSFFAANYFFWLEDGYFSRDLLTKPLLHTWSLAVEEQFYLFYPVMLLLLFRWRTYNRRIALWAVGLIAIVSFALNCYGIVHHPSFTFYGLPTRAWELMAGALVAISGISVKHVIRAQWLSALGVAAILLGAFLLDEDSAFPGAWALLPVGGAVAFLVGNGTQQTLVGRWLSWRPVVFIGLISYSLYLWHWPMLAFVRYLVVDPSKTLLVATVCLSVLIAALSWRFVEQPIRKRHFLATSGRVLAVALLVWSLTLAGSYWVVDSVGLPNRFDQNQADLIEDASWTGAAFSRNLEEIQELGPIPLGIPTDQPGGFLLWGDSHGMTLARTLDDLARAKARHGFAALRGGTPPISGLWRTGMPQCREYNDYVMNFIADRQIKDVILVSRWSVYVSGYSSADPRTDGRQSDDVFLSDSDQASVSGDQSLAAMRRQITRMITKLNQDGVRVWLLRQVPTQQSQVAHLAVRNMLLGAKVNEIKPTNRSLHRLQQSPLKGFYQDAEAAIGTLGGMLSADEMFFDHDSRGLVTYKDRFLYRDDDHLSQSGATYVAPLFQPIFE